MKITWFDLIRFERWILKFQVKLIENLKTQGLKSIFRTDHFSIKRFCTPTLDQDWITNFHSMDYKLTPFEDQQNWSRWTPSEFNPKLLYMPCWVTLDSKFRVHIVGFQVWSQFLCCTPNLNSILLGSEFRNLFYWTPNLESFQLDFKFGVNIS